MGGRRILSDEQIDRMAELRERGWSYPRIAAWFTARGTAVSYQTIRWQCLRVGAFPQGKPPHRNIGRQVGRGEPFTSEQDATILAMRESGARIADIARALDRKQNSVLGRLMTLAMHDDLGVAA